MPPKPPNSHTASIAERLDLARAVSAAEEGQYLNRDNRAGAFDDLSTAVHSRAAFFVRVHPEILAIDMDDPEAQGELDRVELVLHMYAIQPVLVASGQPDRRHLFARVPDPSLMQRIADQAKTSRLDVRTFIRPPLTPHRSGTAAALLEPGSVGEATAVLASAECRPPLSAGILDLIADGDNHGRYASGSEMVQGIALGAVNAGWDYEDFLEVLTDTRTAAGHYVIENRMRGTRGGADEWLRRSWGKALVRAKDRPARPQQILAEIRAFQAWAQHTQWTGRTASTDQMVYLALLTKAEIAGRTHRFDCSEREVELETSLARNTVRKSFRRLEERQLIRRVRQGERACRPPGRCVHQMTHISHTPNLGRYVGHVSPRRKTCSATAPASERRNSGSIKRWSAQPLTEKDLAEQFAMSPRSIHGHVSTLKAFALITQEPSGEWSARPIVDVSLLEREIGVYGRGEAQRARISRERIAHREILGERKNSLGDWGRRLSSIDSSKKIGR